MTKLKDYARATGKSADEVVALLLSGELEVEWKVVSDAGMRELTQTCLDNFLGLQSKLLDQKKSLDEDLAEVTGELEFVNRKIRDYCAELDEIDGVQPFTRRTGRFWPFWLRHNLRRIGRWLGGTVGQDHAGGRQAGGLVESFEPVGADGRLRIP